ncbi:MAG: holo-ACP synthase [Actinomycetota bacterium]|nr:MAG: holo-ACP synthase [Actinomycetota bacterium]
MIVGIGVDVVNVPRFGATLHRTPGVRDRLFTTAERTTVDGHPRTEVSLAARFAAKEAVAKALGAPQGMRWHDCEVVTAANGRPSIAVRGTVAAVAVGLGVTGWHVSLSHDGDVAVAYVVAVAGGDPFGTVAGGDPMGTVAGGDPMGTR